MELEQRDEKQYLVTSCTVEFGLKNGCARVTVCDPCITEEARNRRREAIADKCGELIRRGLM